MQRNLCVYSRGFGQITLHATEAFLRLSTLRLLRKRSSLFLSLLFWQ